MAPRFSDLCPTGTEFHHEGFIRDNRVVRVCDLFGNCGHGGASRSNAGRD